MITALVEATLWHTARRIYHRSDPAVGPVTNDVYWAAAWVYFWERDTYLPRPIWMH